MWCKCCGQDVPGRPVAGSDKLGCPRCSGTLGRERAVETPPEPGERLARPAESAPMPTIQVPAISDDWELDDQLRHLERVLASNAIHRQPTIECAHS